MMQTSESSSSYPPYFYYSKFLVPTDVVPAFIPPPLPLTPTCGAFYYYYIWNTFFY